MSLTPREIPTGAVRFNTDSSKMEGLYRQHMDGVAVSAASVAGGRESLQVDTHHQIIMFLDYIKISSAGNSIDFGDVTSRRISLIHRIKSHKRNCNGWCGSKYA